MFYTIYFMENQNQFTKKTIKLYDELENTDDNIITITESSNLKLGSGGRVWDTVRAIVMSKYIIKQNLDRGQFKKNKIIELGAGTGILSIVLACLGNEVYSTDLSGTIHILEENIENNKLAYEKKGNLTGFVLDWNFDKKKLKDIFIDKNISNLDYVISSDPVVKENDSELFLDSLNNIKAALRELYLEKPINFNILVGFRERDDISLDGFLGEAENKGFRFKKVESSKMDPEYFSSDIHLIELEFDEEERD